MTTTTRFTARGWVRHGLALLSPTAVTAGKVALERDVGLRLSRLRGAALDASRERARPTRRRMRALSVSPGGRLGWRSAPAPPAPRPWGAVVRPVAVATCDLDRPLALGATPFPLPLHLGHECVAEVLQVGDLVRSVRPGDHVVVPFQINCGACRACLNGLTGNCTGVPRLSMYGFGLGGGHWGGAYSDEMAVPFADAMLVALPPAVSPVAAASTADTASDAYRHVRPHLPQLLGQNPDAEVLIVGARSIRSPFGASTALFTGQLALALGARTVVLADARPSVRAQATALGLHAVDERRLARRRPAPLVIDMSASPAGLRAALSLTAPDGTCSSAGNLHTTTTVPTALMFGRNVTLHLGRSHVRTLIPEVLELMAEGRFRPELVITASGPLDEAPELVRRHVSTGSTKTVLSAAP